MGVSGTLPDPDIITGNEGNSYLIGTEGVDVIYGLNGNATPLGRDRDDNLVGGAGNDPVAFSSATLVLVWMHIAKSRLVAPKYTLFLTPANGGMLLARRSAFRLKQKASISGVIHGRGNTHR